MSPRPRTHGPSASRRRRALLDAAVELAGELGAAAVTHRAVAERAGLPPSTTTYFFESIHELVAEALVTYTAERIAEIEQLVAAVPDDMTPSEMFTRAASVLTATPKHHAVAQMEVYLLASRDAELAAPVADAIEAYRRVTVTVLRAAGIRRAQAAARAFQAMADGFALHRLANPGPNDEDELRRAAIALYVAYSLDDDEIAAWERRMSAPLSSADSRAR